MKATYCAADAYAQLASSTRTALPYIASWYFFLLFLSSAVAAVGPLVAVIWALFEVLSVGAGAAFMVGTQLPFMLAWLWPFCGMSGVWSWVRRSALRLRGRG
jgi:hypothetical protein